MALGKKDWRPIAFQGVTFPATLMGISILVSVFDLEEDDDMGTWLWRLSVCRGVTKEATAERCARCAQQAIDLMLENRQSVLDGIRDNLGPCGFPVEHTYRDWIHALQRIVKISNSTSGNCFWSAPLHSEDSIQNAADARRYLQNLNKARSKPLTKE